jgi:hypothetical protein
LPELFVIISGLKDTPKTVWGCDTDIVLEQRQAGAAALALGAAIWPDTLHEEDRDYRTAALFQAVDDVSRPDCSSDTLSDAARKYIRELAKYS